MLLRHFKNKCYYVILKINVITSLRVLFGCGIMTSCVDRENAWNPRRFIGPNPRKARGLGTPRGRRVEFTVYRGYSTTNVNVSKWNLLKCLELKTLNSGNVLKNIYIYSKIIKTLNSTLSR